MASIEGVRICGICLVTDVKMFDISKTLRYPLLGTTMHATLNDAMFRMVGRFGTQRKNRLLCFECAALLRKFDEFRYKCHQAPLYVSLHEIDAKDPKHKIKHFKDDKMFMKRRDRLLSRNKVSLNVSVTSIPPSNPENSEQLVLDGMKTEADEFETNEDYDISKEDGHNFLSESDTDENGLPSYNETSDKYVARKIEEKINSRKRNIIETSFDYTDNEPLSKVIKTISKPKKKEPKLPKKKGPKFDESCFENFTTVTLLTSGDAKKEVELRKETSNYKNCPFKCELCYRGFEAQKAYDNHMKKHSSEFGDKECEYCHLRFTSQKELYKHKFSCHRRKFSCIICAYVCFCTTQAKLHMNLHKGIKYTCEQCGETFSMPNTLFMHKRIKHPTECVCALCGSTFATQRGLQSHHLLLHRQETNLQNGPVCKECDIHFSSETAWKRHLVLSSKHVVSHGCEACGETFPDGDTLKAHSRSHSRKQRTRVDVQLPGPCPLCEKWLGDRSQYREHTTSEHPDSDAAKRIQADQSLPCVCEICGKRFKKPCFLVYHQRQHTGERPHACAVCGARFAAAGALWVHRAAHRAPAPLACRLCRALFRSKGALNKHVKVRHLNLRPHKCGVCGKSFPNKCEVKYHIQYVHCKVPWPKRDRSKAKQPPLA